MSPLKKRARLMESSLKDTAVVVATTTKPNLTPTTVPTLESVNTLLTSVIDQIKSNNGTLSDTRSAVLQMEQWQRQLYETLLQQETKIAKYRTQRQQVQRKQMATAYERMQLQQQITEYQKRSVIPNLEKLARQEEAGSSNSTSRIGGGNVDIEGEAKDNDTILKLVSTFLGCDVHDPNNKTTIIAKLQDGFQKRAQLEKDVQHKKQELLQTQQALKLKLDMLRSLPAQLTAMERASQSLVKFMTNYSSGSSSSSNTTAILGSAKSTTSTTHVIVNSVQHMSGSDRRMRLERAQELPPPLYTLYTLLQNFIDESITTSTTIERPENEEVHSPMDGSQNTNMKLSIIKSAPGSKAETVVWQLPVSEVGTNAASLSHKGKFVSIHFSYSSAPVPTVQVHATGCSTVLNQDILLDELFPGDVAIDTHWLAIRNNTMSGKVYQWSNHLAGLYPIPSSRESSSPTSDASSVLHTSTRVVVHELQRRIRANATLKHILYSLQRLHVPVPPMIPSSISQLAPLLDPTRKSLSKLLSFTSVADSHQGADGETNSSVGTSVYHVELVNESAVSLYATVRIHRARYPSVPPIWHFRTDKETEKSSLYDSRLAQLEQEVNVDMLVRLAASQSRSTTTAGTVDSVIAERNPLYFEWILIHQLREVMYYWDNAAIDDEGTGTESIRKHRGRDRKLI